ncbi:MAG: DMT family transporter [Mesorhizobium sp.]|uniref:DMT family transporter n=1 Tax=Mesorhizobium sp. TaxID=1871066 RepID=UPI0012070D9B|nr:DMT family transporter [Mesorhizobium sp.]TIM31679.1 MAG: DMT family transporter [Mesorhizobium sp.]
MIRAGAQTHGIVTVCLAMALFAANDATIKILAERLGPAQVMLLRGCVGGTILLALGLTLGIGRQLWLALRPAVLLRALCDAMASVMFVMALVGMPVATITALIQLVPILTSVAGVLMFGDVMTRRQSLALAIGLLGVVMITRPSAEGVGIHLLFGIAATVLLTTRDVITRGSAQRVPSLVVATCATLAIPVISIPQLSGETWHAVDLESAVLIGMLGALVAAGNLLMIVAVRSAPLPAIAPYRYSAIPFALIAGAVLLGEFPDALMLAGTGAIALSGVLALPRAVAAPAAEKTEASQESS